MAQSILEDPLLQQQYALASDAFTVIEHLWEVEKDTWQSVVMDPFSRGQQELLSTNRVTAFGLLEEEAQERLHIVKEHLREFHELCLVAELAKHGCDEGSKWHTAGTCALPLIHEPPPQPLDEPWRRLPQMVDHDTSPLHPEKYTLTIAAAKLAALTHSTVADNSVLDLPQEQSGRAQLLREEDIAFRRTIHEHEMLRQGLEAIERTVVEEFRAMQLARLPVEQRDAFVQAPLLHMEKYSRMLIVVEDDAMRAVAALASDAVVQTSSLRAECLQSAQELEARRRQEQQDVMAWTRLHTQGHLRFHTWTRWLRRTQNVVRRRMETAQRQQVVHRALLVRYCGKWFDGTVAPLQARRLQETHNAATLAGLAIVVCESEERERNETVLVEEAARHNIEEMFLTEGDVARITSRDRALQDLEVRSMEAHQLLTLSRWYINVRERALAAKVAWLQQASERVVIAQYFRKWVASPPVARATRQWRQETHRAVDAFACAERCLVLEEEARQRAEIEEHRAWECRIVGPHEDHMMAVCNALQTSRLAALQRRNELMLARSSWRSWHDRTLRERPAARAHQLLHVNHQRVQRSIFTSLYGVVAPRVEMRRGAWSDASSAMMALSGEGLATLRGILEEELAARREYQRRVIQQRRSAAQRAVSTLHKTTQQLARAQCFSSWLGFVERRQQAAHRVATVAAMEWVQQCRLMRRLADRWYASIHCARSARQQVSLLTEEALARDGACALEAAELSSITEVCMNASQAASQAAVERRVEELAKSSAAVIMRRYVSSWERRTARSTHRRAQAAAILRLEARNVQLAAFRLWARAATNAVALRQLCVIKAAADQRVLRKYYLRLAPRMVRLAKVSRARSNLEDAQRAAKILGLADISANVGRAAASIRLAPIRPADTVTPSASTSNDVNEGGAL